MFRYYVAIDWSGADGRYQQGLKVAVTESGRRSVSLVVGDGPRGRWSREEAVDFILDLTGRAECLIGLDFAFDFPADVAPLFGRSPAGRWAKVDAICANAVNFYGGPFYRTPSADHAPFINAPSIRGSRYSAQRWRRTERAARRANPRATPSTMLNFVGAAQVGPSSISGMRALAVLSRVQPRHFSIWPFEPIGPADSAVVEIFPRWFALAAGPVTDVKRPEVLRAALAAFDASAAVQDPLSEDEADAVLSAAALRWIAERHGFPDIPPEADARKGEGWIVGVPYA